MESTESRLVDRRDSAQADQRQPSAVGRPKGQAWPYGFLLPTLAAFTLVYFIPIVRVVVLSFERETMKGVVPVGLANYIYVLTRDPIVREAIGNNLKLLLAVPILVVLSIVVAVLLFGNVRGTRFFQAAILVPYLVSIPIIGLVLSTILRQDGPLNLVLSKVGLGFLAQDWLGDSRLAIFTVMAILVWRELGLGASLFYAQLLTIPEETFDAAKVDGANWRQLVIHIAVPQLRTLIVFYAIYNVIIVFCWTFNYVYVMTYGGPGFSTMVLEFAIYRFVTAKRQPGMASALSVMLFVAILGFVWLQMRMRKSQIEVA